ncbi:hypothetical protein [Gordonia phthalatica]|uniref:Uncharacterized protein n=1 Tax=Gordonia phthalatica TaxID=1136941 RepID=A0A0N9MZS4_9ACTN|nr:hypothetical protein [Gordonia phthalatica]ALG83297.1 hypothetical protein ACH46_00710 [Gordonia phthalatica]
MSFQDQPTHNFDNSNPHVQRPFGPDGGQVPNGQYPPQQPQQPQYAPKAPLLVPGVPKAERVIALIAALIIVVGNTIFFLVNANASAGDGSELSAVQVTQLNTETISLLIAHSVGVTALAYAVILVLRLTGRSPGKNSL